LTEEEANNLKPGDICEWFHNKEYSGYGYMAEKTRLIFHSKELNTSSEYYIYYFVHDSNNINSNPDVQSTLNQSMQCIRRVENNIKITKLNRLDLIEI
jgi:hypothetical protein